MKFYKKNVFILILYILFLIINYYVLTKYSMGNKYSNIRYYFLAILTIIGFIMVLLRKNMSKCKSRRLLKILWIGILFIIISFYKIEGLYLNFRTYVQTFLVICPAILAFEFINLYTLDEIISIMKITLYITIISYFSEPSHSLFSFFSIDKLLSINFLKSNGVFTESSLCSEVFVQLFCFFYYFRFLEFNEKKKKNLNLHMNISLIFVILSFKRLGVLFCLIFFFSSRIIDYSKKVSDKIIISMPFFWCVFTIIYTAFMKGEIFTNIDVYTLTSGRNYILNLWELEQYYSFGYGTSMLVIGRYLEMDLIQIYMELGIFALFCYTWISFKISNKNRFTFIVMFYSFLNMLTASSFPYMVSWILLYITISLINNNEEEENIKFIRSRIVVR